ncbi:uncharacterized protein DUF4270 [Nonlabens dokdonensis]|uniref:Uncharacterized protein n=3 Tax=Nonlabens dokdonensis TaxID=328515 RepID=L7W436_NONDD|nr:hypothetical protein DDD_1213 [Nonlabens dokdonensis DSW-6]PZX44001.1 uncharacterized protein DUF4270 [Nonlabens dokdonensis]
MLCNAAIIIAVILGVVSCENELTPLGSNFLGEDPENIIKEAEFDVKTYSAPVNPVQTNNFPSMPFGFYEDPVYGNSTYSFVSELNLGFQNPDIGFNVELVDIKIDIPYFSTVISQSSTDQTIYELDSLYGNQSIQIELYRSNYFLNSFDPDNISETAVYYSNFDNEIENNLGELLYSDNDFLPSPLEEVVTEDNIVNGMSVTDTIERLSPRYRRSFSDVETERWKEIFFVTDPATGEITDIRSELANNNIFRDYFRGVYFKVNGVTGAGNLVHLNLNEASIIVTIQSDSIDVNDFDEDGQTDDFIANPQSDIRFNFNGARVGFINNEFTPEALANIAASNDPLNGAENTFLKGGAGSVAVVELFGQATNDVDGESPILTNVIQNQWIINEAYIDFYVNLPVDDQGENEPERIIIYDYDTNTLLSDYVITNALTDPLLANLSHLGRLERITNDDGSVDIKYRIRLTQHLNDILAGNIQNNRLGIAVSQNVSLIGNNEVLNQGGSTIEPNIIPLSAAISHEGTVIHGNLSPILSKRPKLKVFYSETTN